MRGCSDVSCILSRIVAVSIRNTVEYRSISWRISVGLTIWDVPPAFPAAQPVLPISHQPRQNQAEGGTAEIKVNPTEVRQEMDLPVFDKRVHTDYSTESVTH